MSVQEKFNEWLSSEEGKSCMTIPNGIAPEYIENRFWRAYMLGMRTAREIDKTTPIHTITTPTETFLKTYKERIYQASLKNKSSKEEYDKLPKLKWLFSDSDFHEMWHPNEEWGDWMLNVLWDNGITSPEDAKYKFELQRFEYTERDCPKCGIMDDHYELSSSKWKCKKCGHKFSITSGTYLGNTKLELFYWFRFAYLIGELKITNSQVIAKDLNVTQATSWFMIETLRNARKQNSENKFVNGQEVLSFNHYWDIIELLVQRTNNKKKKNLKKIEPEIIPVTPVEEIKKEKVHDFINQKL